MRPTIPGILERCFIAALVTNVAIADAQPDPRAVQPERPTVATHAWSVSPGYVEIETGIEYDRFGGDVNAATVPSVVKIGLARRAQLSVGIPVTRPADGTAGIGDVTVGVKYRLTDERPLFGALALLPTVKAPTGSESLGRGTNTTDFNLLAISSRKLGSVALDINAGYTWRSGDGSLAPTGASQWTASFGGPFTERIGWVAEVFGYPGTGGPAGQAPIVAVLAGPTLLTRSWLAFDVGLIAPIHGPQPHALYAGTVYNVGRLFSRR